MNRVLLTTVYGPLGRPDEGRTVGTELFHKQITRAQGIFSVRQVMHAWGLDYIAANLKTPTIVYHYPTLSKFKKEITKIHYTHIGINFVAATFHRAQEMSDLIRKLSPGTNIIFGGYGTVLPDELLTPYCDVICRGDGIPFMRELMKEDSTAPITHPYAPSTGPEVLSYRHPQVVGNITSGLGCPNGCDFCCTSHFFSRRYTPFIKDGKELFNCVLEQYKTAEKRKENMLLVSIIDEDFFHNEPRARQFLEAVRETKPDIGLAGFSSIKSLSRFTVKEIAEMGFDIIWVGIEGKQSGYQKLAGPPPEVLFEELRSYGICTVASSIIGLPYHTRESIREDFERLISLKPTYSQIMIYLPIPGTPLYKKATEENLFLPKYKDQKNWKKLEGFEQFLKYDQFEDGELEIIQDQLYEEEYRRLGPSIYRITDTYIHSLDKLLKSGSQLLEMRAQRHIKTLKPIRSILPIGSMLAPSPEVKENIQRMAKTFRDVYGKWKPLDLAMAAGSPLAAFVTYLRSKTRFENRLGTRRTEYPRPA